MASAVRTGAVLLALAFLLVVGGGEVRTHALDQPAVFTVGILRRDAIVVPFATYDGKKWRADWPEARDDYDVPVDLRSVPGKWWGAAGPRARWQAWIDRDAPRLLTVLQPDWFPAYCRRAIGLRTDYHPRERVPPLTARPFPTDGLAVSPPQPIERIAVLGAADPSRARLAQAVLADFNQTERQLAPYPIGRAYREKIAPAIEAEYATADSRVVYVEAAREYRQHEDPAAACQAVAFGGGWFVRGEDQRYTPLQTYVAVLDCDRDGASYMLPLGIVRLSGRTFWIAQFSGWDAEQYEVDEIKPKTVERLVSRFGGGC